MAIVTTVLYTSDVLSRIEPVLEVLYRTPIEGEESPFFCYWSETDRRKARTRVPFSGGGNTKL